MNFEEYTDKVIDQCGKGNMPFLTRFYPKGFTLNFISRYINASWITGVPVENCAISLEGLFQDVYDEKVACIPMKES